MLFPIRPLRYLESYRGECFAFEKCLCVCVCNFSAEQHLSPMFIPALNLPSTPPSIEVDYIDEQAVGPWEQCGRRPQLAYLYIVWHFDVKLSKPQLDASTAFPPVLLALSSAGINVGCSYRNSQTGSLNG